MFAQCPSCGSKAVREARRRSLTERLAAFAGYIPVRCEDCGNRYRRSTLILREFYYAHCPICLSQRLTDWEEKYYFPGVFSRMLTYVGGRQHRCDPCRHNFVSFRPRKKMAPIPAPKAFVARSEVRVKQLVG